MKTHVLNRYFEGLALELTDKSILVIYHDLGPKGPCGQSSSVMCAHTYLHYFPSEDEFQKYLDEQPEKIRKDECAIFGRSGQNASVAYIRKDSGLPVLYDHSK